MLKSCPRPRAVRKVVGALVGAATCCRVADADTRAGVSSVSRLRLLLRRRTVGDQFQRLAQRLECTRVRDDDWPCRCRSSSQGALLAGACTLLRSQ